MSKSDLSENRVIVSEQSVIQQRWGFRENKEVQYVEFAGLTDSVYEMAFYKCTNLTQVILPYTVRSIEYSAFEGCKKLASIQLPFALEKIGDSAFRTCEKLQSVAIPLRVKSIGKTAFRTCKSLKEIRISKTVKKIGKDAFTGCPNLVIITEKGSAAEKYALDAGIPVQILPTEELNTAIREECMPEQDLLEGKLTIAKYKRPAAIAEKNGHRTLVINYIQYEKPEWWSSDEEYYGDPLPKFPFIITVRGEKISCACYSRADMIQNVLALKKVGSEVLESFLSTGRNLVKEIADYDMDSAGEEFAAFRSLCERMNEENVLRLIADFVPRKKDGSLAGNRKTLLASLPVFIHMGYGDKEHDPYLNGERSIDYRYDKTYDLVAKNISDDVIVVYVEGVDLYNQYEQDHVKTSVEMAGPETAKQIMEA